MKKGGAVYNDTVQSDVHLIVMLVLGSNPLVGRGLTV